MRTYLKEIQTREEVEACILKMEEVGAKDRRRIARQLVEFGDGAVEPLIKALSDKHTLTRASAAWALGEIGAARSIESIAEATKDPKPSVRDNASEALIRLKKRAEKHRRQLQNKKKLHKRKPHKSQLVKRVKDTGKNISYEMRRILNTTRLRIVDSVNLFFGRGIYSDAILSSYYSLWSSGHGMTIDIDMAELNSILSNQAPCENCGTILQKPAPYTGFVGSCPQCHCIQEYAKEAYHAAQAKLVRRELRKDKKLRQHFDEYLKRERWELYRIYRRDYRY